MSKVLKSRSNDWTVDLKTYELILIQQAMSFMIDQLESSLHREGRYYQAASILTEINNSLKVKN